MLRIFVCLFLFLLIRINATDYRKDENDTKFDEDNLQVIQDYEESAKHMWELTTRTKPSDVAKEADQSATSSSESVELFTWFPWFENNQANIQTIKAIATFKPENSSKLSSILGVGTWQEITLFGKRKEDPDASALWRNPAVSLSPSTKWIIAFVCFAYLLTD